jgi:hypothetical protein
METNGYTILPELNQANVNLHNPLNGNTIAFNSVPDFLNQLKIKRPSLPLAA